MLTPPNPITPAAAVPVAAGVTATVQSIDHAKHNREVCDLLMANGNYADWVVTTAFYSAMHRVQAHVFPYTEGGKTYANIGQYAAAISSAKQKVSKHEATKRIVRKLLPAVANKYYKLFDICHTARYIRYQTSNSVAQQARAYLAAIEQACV